MTHRPFTSTARVCATFAACAGLALAVGCTEEAIDPLPEPIDSYVGAIAGTDAVFAVTATEHEVVLYVCGGETTLARHSRWYRGQRSEGEPALLTAADGSTAVVRFSSDGEVDRVEGEVDEQGGTRLALAAELTAPDSVAGLYGVVDSGCRTGVVVRQGTAGEAPEVQGTWCSDEGIFAQVTPIAPIETRGSFAVHVIDEQGKPSRSLVVLGINPADF